MGLTRIDPRAVVKGPAARRICVGRWASAVQANLRQFLAAAALVAVSLCSVAGSSHADPVQQGDDMKIRIVIGNTEMTARLEDSAAGRDFASLLPMTVTLTDYAATEKVSDLPRKLDTAGAPAGIDPDIGDITYYAPWGNLAIFYKDFGYARGLVKLGVIDGDIGVLAKPGPLQAVIELVE